MSTTISGTVRAGFEPIRDVFLKAFADHPRMGAALHVLRNGETVIDLWGGVADARSGRPWKQDTPSVIFSCTKGLVSILAARLVQEGRLDYREPVSRYWPEFAAAGKAGITLGDALAHRAGLSAPRSNWNEDDIVHWERAAADLAAQRPLWPLGTGYAYHALTHGWLAGEIIRRVTGTSVGAYFAELIATPLHAQAWIGLPDGMQARAAHLEVSPSLSALWRDEAAKPEPNWPHKAMTLGNALPADLVTENGGFNNPRIRAAEIPGAGGIATAEALATIWSATVVETKGVRLIDNGVIAEATRPKSSGAPVFGGEPPYSSWGYGFQLNSPARRYLDDNCFGHDGAGGQVGFADPLDRVGFGFVTNWMMGPEDQRATQIISTLRDLL